MPLVDGFDDESILSIGNLGVVAGAYDSLHIADTIDSAIPKTRAVHCDCIQCSAQHIVVKVFGRYSVDERHNWGVFL